MKLLTPGPTPVHPEVLKVMAQPMIHHRSPEFGEILKTLRADLNWLAGTQSGESVIFSSSGSGGMEAVVASMFSPGDEVVVVEGGKFGERWAELTNHYKLNTNVIHVEWGRAATVEQVLTAVTPQTKAVFIQASETSTGVAHPIGRIGESLRSSGHPLFVVDGITALGVYDLDMDRDHIDVLVCGSQKALMTPPGLATVTLSSRAIEILSGQVSRSRYFSIQMELASQKKNTTAFTPAISLFKGLAVALSALRTEGKASLFARTHLMQSMARKAFTAMGLELYNTEEEASPAISVIKAPKGVDLKQWLDQLKFEEELWLAGGQGELAGKVFRISHMGMVRPKDLLDAIATIEKSLMSYFPQAKEGLAVAKAKEVMEGKA